MASLYFILMTKKNPREAYTAHSININFECGPQVKKVCNTSGLSYLVQAIL